MTRTEQHQRYISAIHGRAAALGVMFVTALIGTASQGQTYTVLHRFKGSPTDGADPRYGDLIGGSAGNFYGTTWSGGASNQGAVFKLDTNGETVLYSFTGGADGGNPEAGLIRDLEGNLYGTAEDGGAANLGVVFKLDTTGAQTVLHSFTGGADGANPFAGLIRDWAGNLYGTTVNGGASTLGVVFKLDTTGAETVLYSFAGGADGANPYAGLIRDSAGNLYGTAVNGGAWYLGDVFKLDTTGRETVLYSFSGADGAGPFTGLIRDSAGNLYGTTVHGGPSGQGVVFKLDTTGMATVLHSFAGGADGANPYAGLIRASTGNLYGTASSGGIFGNGKPLGGGVVFKIQP